MSVHELRYLFACDPENLEVGILIFFKLYKPFQSHIKGTADYNQASFNPTDLVMHIPTPPVEPQASGKGE